MCVQSQYRNVKKIGQNKYISTPDFLYSYTRIPAAVAATWAHVPAICQALGNGTVYELQQQQQQNRIKARPYGRQPTTGGGSTTTGGGGWPSGPQGGRRDRPERDRERWRERGNVRKHYYDNNKAHHPILHGTERLL